MRQAVAVVAVGALAVVLSAIASAAQSRPVESDQEILIQLEQGWNEAFYAGDVAFLDSILADDFVATYDNGRRGNKATELALAQLDHQVESAVQDDFLVRVYRDTAVVWFTLRVVVLRQGEREELTLHYTDVWVVRDGRWQCVSTHSTRVAS